MENRIGKLATPDTPQEWPEFSISGRDYLRPARTIALGGGRFVVIDLFPMEGWRDEVEKLKGKGASSGTKRTIKED